MMINCPKCQAELSDQDVFCFVCGYKTEPPVSKANETFQATEDLTPCPKCNAMPLSKDDVFCAECGNRLIPDTPQTEHTSQPQHDEVVVSTQPEPEYVPEAPESQDVVKENTQPKQQIIPEQQKPVQPEVTVPPAAQQTAQPVAPVAFQPAPRKKKKTGKVIFTIFLILLFAVVIGGGIVSFMIYNGNISRQNAGQYIPKSLLDLIPQSNASSSTTATRYFVVYTFGQFEKQPVRKGKKAETEKLAVISDIFTNLDAGTETNDGAEVVFRNEGNTQVQKFSRFTKFFVNSFTTHQEAMTEREKIIQDLKSKGYKRQFVRVAK